MPNDPVDPPEGEVLDPAPVEDGDPAPPPPINPAPVDEDDPPPPPPVNPAPVDEDDPPPPPPVNPAPVDEDDPPPPPPVNPAPQDDQDATGNRPFISSLLKALSGKGFSDNFTGQMDRTNQTISGLLDDPDSIDPDDLPFANLVEAAAMFGQDPEDIQIEATGRMKKLKLLLTDRARLRQIASQKETKAQLQKLIDELGTNIEERLEEANSDAASQVKFAETRVKFLELSQLMFEGRKFQQAFDLAENAQALKRIVEFQDDRENLAPGRVPEGQVMGPDRSRDDPGFQLSDQNPLPALLRAVTGRRESLMQEVARINGLIGVLDETPDEALATFREVVQGARRVDLTGLDVSQNDPAVRSKLDRADANLAELEGKLATLDGLGTDVARTARNKAKKELKKLVHFDGSDAEREGADVTGAGTVAMRGKARDVPQAVVKPLLAKYDALKMLEDVGGLSEAELSLILQFDEELAREAQVVLDNLDTYKNAAKIMAKCEKILKDDVFEFNAAKKRELDLSLEQLENGTNDLSPAGLLSKAGVLKGLVDTALSDAKDAKKLYKKRQKEFGKERDKIIKLYKTELKVLIGLDDGETCQGLKAKYKTIRKELKTEGRYAEAFDEIWALVQMGDVTTYADGSAYTLRLAADVATFTREINAFAAQLTVVKERMERAGSSFDEWYDAADDTNPFKNAVTAAAGQITGVHSDLEAREEAERNFKSDLKRIKKFVNDNKAKITQDAREGFENYLLLLDALDGRSKACVKLGDWQDLNKELHQYDATIQGYLQDHAKLDDETSSQDAMLQAANILAGCRRSIDDFRGDVQRLYDDIVGAQRAAAEGAPTDDDAVAIVALLDHRTAELQRFITGIRDAIKDDSSAAVEAALKDADPDDDQRIALREKAIAILRRRRMFLEQNKAALTYRNNPFDLGAPATVLIAHLAAAESRILSIVKRG